MDLFELGGDVFDAGGQPDYGCAGFVVAFTETAFSPLLHKRCQENLRETVDTLVVPRMFYLNILPEFEPS